METLVKPESKEKLTGILTYHVLAGKVLSSDLTDGMVAKTVNGEEITIRLKDGKVFVNDSEVVIADVETSNGIVHAIDKVLMPAA